jgi:hypothetical protein
MFRPSSLLACKVCLPPLRESEGGVGKTILVRRRIVHNLVPLLGLIHLEDTAFQFSFAGRPVKILAP